MFTEIKLTNFKGYRTASIALRDLTIIVGQNNAGKSSILHPLLMLAQTVNSASGATLITSGNEVDVGSGGDLLHVGAGDDPYIEIGLTLDKRSSNEYGGDQLDLQYRVSRDSFVPRLTKSLVRYKERDLLGVTRNGSDHWTLLGAQSESEPSSLEGATYGFLPAVDLITADAVGGYLQQQSLRLFLHWRNMFQRVWHIRPVRKDIPPFGQVGKTFDSPPESGGESFLASLRDEHDATNTLRRLNDWVNKHNFMVKNLDLRPVDEGGRLLSLYGVERGCEEAVNVANMGRGISQSLPVLARILRAGDGDCGLIEQPELHLHPGAQAEIADAMVEHIIRNKRSQLIIETHSEHFLSRIRRHVANGTLRPNAVAIVSVSRDCGNSKAETLYLDKFGTIKGSPQGFFQEGYNEALAIARETRERRVRLEAAAATT